MDGKVKEKGILKLEPRPRIVVEGKGELTPQVSGEHVPVSPQPSVDRLSVTWADPSMASSVNLFHLPSETPLVSEVTFSPGGEGSEDEDYSASLSAVLRQRRASVRRSRKGRARRPSSPFLADERSARRRSSVFTTSSGDTAISMEESQPAVATQEQIFENIHLNKEVLTSVKQQPLELRRKLKIVHQAKAYIKRHEGQLQERLAQSKSTRDIYARFSILMTTRWQQLKREAANTSNLLIPWELRIKEIESHFGSVVASYFTFLRWLFWVNLVIAFVLLVFVIVPEYLTGNAQQDGERKTIMDDEKQNASNLLTLWEFEGVLKYSPIFYGFYTNVERAEYRMPLAYFLTGLVVYIYSFVAILRKMAENSRMSKLSEKEDECIFSWKLFTGWDFMIGNAETAHNRIASVSLGFKEALLEEAEKKKDLRNWRIISLRAIVNICVVMLLVVSAYAVVTVVYRSNDNSEVRGWWRENETTIVVTVISITFPVFFELLGFLEHYHPRKQLRLQLARIMLLNLLNLYSLIFALFSKIEGMSRELDSIKPNLTMNAVMIPDLTLNQTESMISNFPFLCYQEQISCLPCGMLVTQALHSTTEEKPVNKKNMSNFILDSNNLTRPNTSNVNGILSTSFVPELPKVGLETHEPLTRMIAENLIDKEFNDTDFISSTTGDLFLDHELQRLRNISRLLEFNESSEYNPDYTDYNREENTTDEIFPEPDIDLSTEFTGSPTHFSTSSTEYEYVEKDYSIESETTYPSNVYNTSEEYGGNYNTTSGIKSEGNVTTFAMQTTNLDDSFTYGVYTTDENIISATSTRENVGLEVESISTPSAGQITDNGNISKPTSDHPKLNTIEYSTESTLSTDSEKINTPKDNIIPVLDYTGVTEESTTTMDSVTLCPNVTFNCSVNCMGQNVTQVTSYSNCTIIQKACYVTRCKFNITDAEIKRNLTNTTAVGAVKDIAYIDEHQRKMYNLTTATRKKLLKLCWETMFGQELVKLTMMDLVFVLLGTLFMDFFRSLFVRYMNRCWCWDLEKRFPEYGDFKIAENILHLINNQGMVWMGMFFSPGLVVLNVFKLMIMMYLRSWAVMTCNVPHEVVFRVSKSNNFYLALLLTMLFLCVLPVGYAIVWVKPSWHCGPFSEYERIYYIVTSNIYKILPKSLNFALKYIASPAIVIPLLVLLILIIYYLTSLTNSLREANNDLKHQLRRERTEERRKMFQLADTRRRTGSVMENTPFARWKKALPSLPMSKSIDSDERKTIAGDEEKEPHKATKKRGGIFAKIVSMALDKKQSSEGTSIASPSPNNVDEETDTDFHETLPKDVLKVKDIIFNKTSESQKSDSDVKHKQKSDENRHQQDPAYRKENTSSETEQVATPKEQTLTKHKLKKLARTALEDISKERKNKHLMMIADDRTEKMAVMEKRKQEAFKEERMKSKPKSIIEEAHVTSRDNKKLSRNQNSESSTQSKQSDSIGSVIPVITISTTESDEEVLQGQRTDKYKVKKCKEQLHRHETRTTKDSPKKSKRYSTDSKSLRRQSSVDSINDHKLSKDKNKEKDEGHKYQYSL